MLPEKNETRAPVHADLADEKRSELGKEFAVFSVIWQKPTVRCW